MLGYGHLTEVLGAVECLAQETRLFGVGVHIFVLGQFRTNILNVHKKKSELDPDQGHECYAEIKTQLAERHAVTAGAQPGDPAVGAERIVDIAKNGAGVLGVSSACLPLRIPIGLDTIQVMRSKCQDTLALLAEWEGFARSAEFQDAPEIPCYLK